MWFRKKHKEKDKHGKNEKHKSISKKALIVNSIISIVIGLISFIFTKSLLGSVITIVVVFAFLIFYVRLRIKLKHSSRIRKMEEIFPDFLQLMSSNLRAGMTTDKALLLSARKEFAPLDSEIIRLGKSLVTGAKIEDALIEMGKRIKSDRINQTIKLIVSGIKSGGNISILLENTATNMKERGFIEKRAASNVLMYVIFIFFATAVGAPVLFGLASILVEVLSTIVSTIPSTQAGSAIPLTFSEINISISFITYYSLIFLIVTDIIGSLVLGLVGKGEEKEGVKYMIPLIISSLFIFFAMKLLLRSFLLDLFVT